MNLDVKVRKRKKKVDKVNDVSWRWGKTLLSYDFIQKLREHTETGIGQVENKICS